METTVVFPISTISFKDLTGPQQNFVLLEGPHHGDMGNVKSFVGNFEARFGVLIAPEAMKAILAKAVHKRKRIEKGEKAIRPLPRRGRVMELVRKPSAAYVGA